MIELTTNSVRSAPHPAIITEQPNRFSRWWMRHYLHIGLASMGGSAILVCIIAIILLPIVFHSDELCADVSNPWIGPTTPIPWPSTMTTSTNGMYPLTTTSAQTVSFDPLCAANAIWKKQGVTVAGSLTSSSSLTDLNGPTDILIDANGNLFISDTQNNRIVCWVVNATQGRIVAGTGVLGSWINLFKYPAAIVAWKDQMYVSDLRNYRILAFPLSTTGGSPDGMTIVGRYGLGSALNQINLVYYMAVDSVRELFYLSDFTNNRILTLNLTTDTLQLAAGTGLASSNSTSLNLPLGITVDTTTGSLYVADSQNHRVQKFNFGSVGGITIAGGMGYGQNLSQLYLPSGVALDPAGNVYVADGGNKRIVQWLVGAQQGRIIAGTGVSGANNTQLNNPTQLKFDVHNNLYVVDQNNNRVQRFDLLNNGC